MTYADTVKVSSYGEDVSWKIYDLFAWAQVELQLGIICASAPSLHVFFRRCLSKSCVPTEIAPVAMSEGQAKLVENNNTASSVGLDKIFESARPSTVIASRNLCNHFTKANLSEASFGTGAVTTQDGWASPPTRLDEVLVTHETNKEGIRDPERRSKEGV